MGLVDDAGAALAEFRAEAEALMVDTCTVKRVTGNATDPITGAVTPTYSTVYTGRCKVQSTPGAAAGAEPDSGEHRFTVQALQLHVPIGTGPVRVGDLAEVTAAANDAQLVSRTYRVTGEHHKSWSTAQRVPIEEVQA